MTAYARAVAGYDVDFERHLAEAITTAIAKASLADDANVLMLRTGETTSALLTVLAGTLALSPAATRSPSAVRKTLDQLGKRLRQRIAAAERDPATQDFLRRTFHGDHGGHDRA